MLRVFLKMLRTLIFRFRCRRWLSVGDDFHVGSGVRIWAPNAVCIGDHVYLGKGVHIECDAQIGDFVVMANRVAFVARRDYDFSVVGVPIRFSPRVAPGIVQRPSIEDRVTVGSDVWVGYGAVVLSGVELGRGCVVGAGAVVTRSVPPYAVVAGNPAVIKRFRFSDQESIAAHEAGVAQGNFRFSERGYAYARIERWDGEGSRREPTAGE